MRQITRQKTRKTVYLDKLQYDALRKIARRRKVSLSQLGREAIAQVLRKHRKEEKHS